MGWVRKKKMGVKLHDQEPNEVILGEPERGYRTLGENV